MNLETLKFLPINLELHSELCLRFLSDSFVCSFGTETPFMNHEEQSGNNYLNWLKKRSTQTRYGVFHVWRNKQIIGQMELGERNSKDDFGYVHLYYLIPECRGQGYSELLDNFAITFIRELGFSKMRLSVCPMNNRAMNFYKKNAWIDLGLRDEPELKEVLSFPLHYMEKHI